ncbi:right-handed parallel beta-helix repeat-containing protein [Cohnella zeiphila]|uniref:Right-handed parallel beta-helix repeat-containing protein n=1 Tax=Cohnella zeiphila TaxID=2761120 RepID=A0A7X0SNW7_9BACL|nr:right-handed parallel beta-helix repeat-containing protein [Cohnella zeiphila]MBB6733301.1 right-handed parallel beta-helix repeat-containing protein [Cohnella zeiphila]
MMREFNPEPTVILLTDFGARPDSGEDALPAMRRALSAAADVDGPVVLQCPRGRYDFYPGDAVRVPLYISNTASEEECPDTIKTVALWLQRMSGFTLAGDGSLFVFHGKMTMFAMEDCEDIEIRDVHMDYERPTVVEMTVAGRGENWLDLAVHPDAGYVIEDGKLVWLGDGWRFRDGPMQQYDPERGTTWRIDNGVVQASRVEEQGVGRLRLRFAGPAPDVAPGHVLQARDGIRDQVGAFLHRSRNIRWRRVGMHFMHGLGIVGQFSEELSFEDVTIAPRPETGRTVAGFADGIHLSGCRGRIRIEGCRFEGLHDDGVNVHGTHLRIVGVAPPNRMTVRFMHPQSYGFEAFFPGDAIEFVDRDSLVAYGAGAVKTAERLGPREIRLTLEEALPDGVKAGDAVDNVTWTPEVSIVGNTFARIPTRGVLVTTRRKAVIENNRFERMPMSAVLVADDARSWYESGPVRDLAVRGNEMIECGWLGHPAIAVVPENAVADPTAPVHQNIVIENNRFLMRDNAVLHARSVRTLIFRHNRMAVRDAGEDSEAAKTRFVLTACSEVVISDNKTEGDRPLGLVQTESMGTDGLFVSPDQGLLVL